MKAPWCRKRGFGWLVVMALMSSPAVAEDLRLPPGVQVADVAEHMTWNGLPMRVQSFKSDMDIDRVLEAIARSLRDAGIEHPDVISTLDIKTLGAVVDGTFVNVQGQNRSGAMGSAGYIVYSPLLRDIPAAEDRPGFPLTPDISVMSHETYDDQGRRGETLLGVSPRSATDVGQALADVFEAQGWQSVRPAMAGANSGQTPRIYWLRKGERTCRLLARDQSQQGQIRAVVSVVCHD